MVTLRIVTILASLLTMTAVLWAADLAFYLDLLVFTEQFLAFVLGLTLALVFLSIRIDGVRNTDAPWYDYFAALLGLISAGYVALIYPTLADELAYTPLQSVVLSSILLVLIVEAVRRAAGTSLAILIALFIAYGLFGHLLPGQLAGRNMRYERFVTLLVLDPNGVLGTPLKIGATIVAVFVLCLMFGELAPSPESSAAPENAELALASLPTPVPGGAVKPVTSKSAAALIWPPACASAAAHVRRS